MKTLASSLLLAAVAATVVLPLNFAAAGSLLLVTGLTAMMVSDYARHARRVSCAAMPASRIASLRLAA